MTGIARGDPRQARPLGRARLEPRQSGLVLGAGERGSDSVGPCPTDQGRGGTKLHLIVDCLGSPLALLFSGANRKDSKLLEPLLDAVRPVRSARGRPRRWPAKLHADKAYDHAFCREACRARGVLDRIAHRGVESSERFGRQCWVVERAFAHLRSMRRLSVRWERKTEYWLAFALLGCALLCLRRLAAYLGL